MKYLIKDIRIQPEHMKPSTAGANSVDLRACMDETLVLMPGQQKIINCGIQVELPSASMGMLLPRSGKGIKGVVLGNLVGNIDPDYRGDIKVCLWNRGIETQVIEPMERIAQFVVLSAYNPNWIQATELTDTSRGAGGFGSTGSS